MKKLVALKIFVFLLVSCNGTTTVKPETIGRGGEILSGDNKGGDYKFGSMEMANLAISFSNAFVNEDYSFVTEKKGFFKSNAFCLHLTKSISPVYSIVPFCL